MEVAQAPLKAPQHPRLHPSSRDGISHTCVFAPALHPRGYGWGLWHQAPWAKAAGCSQLGQLKGLLLLPSRGQHSSRHPPEQSPCPPELAASSTCCAAAVPYSPPDGFALRFPNWAFVFPAAFSNLSDLSGIRKSSQFCILGGFCACAISSLVRSVPKAQ